MQDREKSTYKASGASLPPCNVPSLPSRQIDREALIARIKELNQLQNNPHYDVFVHYVISDCLQRLEDSE